MSAWWLLALLGLAHPVGAWQVARHAGVSGTIQRTTAGRNIICAVQRVQPGALQTDEVLTANIAAMLQSDKVQAMLKDVEVWDDETYDLDLDDFDEAPIAPGFARQVSKAADRARRTRSPPAAATDGLRQNGRPHGGRGAREVQSPPRRQRTRSPVACAASKSPEGGSEGFGAFVSEMLTREPKPRDVEIEAMVRGWPIVVRQQCSDALTAAIQNKLQMVQVSRLMPHCLYLTEVG